MLQLMEEERRKGTRPKDEIYRRIGKRIGLSESAVKRLSLKAERGEGFDIVLDRRIIDWGY
jgi:hypothetical protein